MISMLKVSEEEFERIRQASIAQANALEARTEKVSPRAALELMLSPRGFSAMSRFLAIAFWAHDRLPRHRQTPSDAAAVATIFFSVFRGSAWMELRAVFEQAGIDGHLDQAAEEPSKANPAPRTSRRPPDREGGVRLAWDLAADSRRRKAGARPRKT